jgi:hypothetical protein
LKRTRPQFAEVDLLRIFETSPTQVSFFPFADEQSSKLCCIFR